MSAFLGELRAYLDSNLERDWVDEHEEVPAHVLAELK